MVHLFSTSVSESTCENRDIFSGIARNTGHTGGDGIPCLEILSLRAIKAVIVPDIVKNIDRTSMDGIDEAQLGKSSSREK